MAKVFGIDPGTFKAGWVLYDTCTEQPLKSGHDEWAVVRDKLRTLGVDACVVEEVILYSGQSKGSNTIMPKMIEHVGRIQQICEDDGITYSAHTRMDICKSITGARPKRNSPITKADMQSHVQALLDLDKPVRPQHANDALAAVLTTFPPQ